jgi:glycosyltransferase involved in cell wall biosynthesis
LNLLFFIPEDWYVCSHRLPLIRGARRDGHQVTVVTRIQNHGAAIEAAGAELLPTKLRRGFRNPVGEVLGLIELVKIYRRCKPDLVHHVTPKSSLFGSFAAWVAGVPGVVNALAGLGYLFASRGLVARILRPAVSMAFRFFLGRGLSRVIVQNEDDQEFFTGVIGIDPARVVLIRGSGVDTSEFQPGEPPPTGKIRVCLVARMIWEKGIRETVFAARQMKMRRQDIEFILVGASDTESPSGVPEEELRAWHQEGVITWLGHVDDVATLLATCHLALLPTYYREGFPKSLLEAAACGLPVVATDVTGCRDICQDGVNGLLIPPRDPEAIVDAVAHLADDPELRSRFGRESRRLVETRFSEEIVVEQTMDLYRTMLQELGKG